MNLKYACLSSSLGPTAKCFEIIVLQWLSKVRIMLLSILNASHLAICHTLSLSVPCQSPLCTEQKHCDILEQKILSHMRNKCK